MMRTHVEKSLGFAKTTAIGGLVFLLPLVVVVGLIGQAVAIALPVVKRVLDLEFLKGPDGAPNSVIIYSVVAFLLAIALIVLLCFLAGIAARRSLGRKFTETVEKNLTMLFPRYAIFKDQLSGTLGGELASSRLRPVVVRANEMVRLGLEVERRDGELVAVYLPGAPDPWTGSVAMFRPDQLEPLDVEFADVMATFETLGRESLRFVVGGDGRPA
ncbi:MAG: DUF502 domain-containing protein, partial [Planctomycetota bacterium]